MLYIHCGCVQTLAVHVFNLYWYLLPCLVLWCQHSWSNKIKDAHNVEAQYLYTVKNLFQARFWTGYNVHSKCVLKYFSLLFASQDSSSDDIWGPSQWMCSHCYVTWCQVYCNYKQHSSTGTGWVFVSSNKVIVSKFPLYFECLCPSNR